MEFVGHLLRHVIAQLNGAQLGITAILDVVAADATLVIRIARGERGDVAVIIEWRPGVEYTHALVQVRNVDG